MSLRGSFDRARLPFPQFRQHTARSIPPDRVAVWVSWPAMLSASRLDQPAVCLRFNPSRSAKSQVEDFNAAYYGDLSVALNHRSDIPVRFIFINP